LLDYDFLLLYSGLKIL